MSLVEPIHEPRHLPAGWSTSEEGDLFLAEAATIGERLLEKRILARNGSFSWIGPAGYGTEVYPLRIVKLGPYLYDGTAGIALFLAALERVVGGGRYGEMALQAIRPLRRKMSELIADPERGHQLRMPIGGLIGIGSLIYSFLKIGEWLGDSSLSQEAHDLTIFITPERIALDERVRIQTGSAGAILALLALNACHPEPNRDGRTPLAIAEDCASHLLAQRIAYEDLPRAWRLSPGKPPLADFGYGAAGIAYALLRLQGVNQNSEVRKAAEEGFAFVDALYSPEHRSWRDIRADFETHFQGPELGTWRDWWASGAEDVMSQLESRSKNPEAAEAQKVRESFPSSWCHGSAGIALGRLAVRDLLDRTESWEAVTGALQSLRRIMEAPSFAEQGAHDLCCGHFGRIEVLLEASRRLQAPDLLATARSLAVRVALRAQEVGRYELSAARGSGEYSPALFQGEAGIGYTLLRLARPESLPCLLLLE
ncbi:MAG TPA: lanthionine synthetase LanC family protein [Thermoanaerobaculia bacterium]|jgi:lantibiotic modifying enzyme